MDQVMLFSEESDAPALIEGRDRTGRFVILCDHASNRFLEKYARVKEFEALAKEHVSWDPGALPVAQALAEELNAPLVYSTVSRLVVDCNRENPAPDLIPAKTERGFVEANANLDKTEISYRYGRLYPVKPAGYKRCTERLGNVT